MINATFDSLAIPTKLVSETGFGKREPNVGNSELECRES